MLDWEVRRGSYQSSVTELYPERSQEGFLKVVGCMEATSMADILLRFDGIKGRPVRPNESVERIWAGQKGECWIYGMEGTFCLARDGEDTIASIGYVSENEASSVHEVLSQTLSTFQESKIGELKKALLGQYAILVKKGKRLYLFSDFMGSRNIFYLSDGTAVCSSFSQIEDLVQTSQRDLDTYKVLEFLAMRHVLYPTWLGRSTEHKKIKWLLPYEYISFSLEDAKLRVGSIVYSIDNEKQADCTQLSDDLVQILRTIVGRKEFRDCQVAASLTGGRDSRLVAALAAEQYPNIRYRTAVSTMKYSSLRDYKIAQKLARVRSVPLDPYWFRPGRDEQRFHELTEGFSPSYNSSIAPLIDSAGRYSIGLGGVFGTELFMPIPWPSVEDFIEAKIKRAMQALVMENGFWAGFRTSLHEQFQEIREHYQLSEADDRDYIRLFGLLDTARYGSFIMAAFNRVGYQLEPYGNYAVLNLALRVAPELWGNHRTIEGDALVQRGAMEKFDPQLARVLTYKNFRPMVAFSASSFLLYFVGYSRQIAHWARERLVETKKVSRTLDFQSGCYYSDGWDQPFIDRSVQKYGLAVGTHAGSGGVARN